MRSYLKNKTVVLIFKWVVFVKEVERKIKDLTRTNKNMFGGSVIDKCKVVLRFIFRAANLPNLAI